MPLSRRNFLALGSSLCLPVLGHTEVPDQRGLAQYRAAMTRLWLQNFHAFPIFAQNPIFPGSVLDVRSEMIELAPDTCYKHHDVRYKALPDVSLGESLATRADLRVGGNLLSAYIARAEAEVDARFARAAVLSISPLSDATFWPDLAALSRMSKLPVCQPIRDVLAGQGAGRILVGKVYHGQVRYSLTGQLSGDISLEAQSTVSAKLVKIFSVDKADVVVSGSSISIFATGSSGPLTLAVTPVNLNTERLIRITKYLQGSRGIELENAVNDILLADTQGEFDRNYHRVMTLLRGMFSDDISKKEGWVRYFLEGAKVNPADEVANRIEKQEINLRAVANYAAARESVKVPALWLCC
jgi:hypothetical protein